MQNALHDRAGCRLVVCALPNAAFAALREQLDLQRGNHRPVVRVLQFRHVAVVREGHCVGVREGVALPQHPVRPGRHPRLGARVVRVRAVVEFEGWRECDVPFVKAHEAAPLLALHVELVIGSHDLPHLVLDQHVRRAPVAVHPVVEVAGPHGDVVLGHGVQPLPPRAKHLVCDARVVGVALRHLVVVRGEVGVEQQHARGAADGEAHPDAALVAQHVADARGDAPGAQVADLEAAPHVDQRADLPQGLLRQQHILPCALLAPHALRFARPLAQQRLRDAALPRRQRPRLLRGDHVDVRRRRLRAQ
mmetsp:Transcript_39944/g.102160  ORF Transcript_39944/g.102160 Transcript_39944/m.102160 type:complete len:306 (-) Transcript_39944:572-1489(-)